MGDVTVLLQTMRELIQQLDRLSVMLAHLVNPREALAMMIRKSGDFVFSLWFNFVLSTTDVGAQPARDLTRNGVITSFEPTVQLVADSLLVLVVVWGSYRIMWGHGVRSQFTARVLLPRVFLAGVLINFCMPMLQAAVA